MDSFQSCFSPLLPRLAALPTGPILLNVNVCASRAAAAKPLRGMQPHTPCSVSRSICLGATPQCTGIQASHFVFSLGSDPGLFHLEQGSFVFAIPSPSRHSFAFFQSGCYFVSAVPQLPPTPLYFLSLQALRKFFLIWKPLNFTRMLTPCFSDV